MSQDPVKAAAQIEGYLGGGVGIEPQEIAELGTLVCEDCGELILYEGILVNSGRVLRGKDGEILQAVCEDCFGEADETDEW